MQDVIVVAMLGDSQASAAGIQVNSTRKVAGDHSRMVYAYNSGTFTIKPLAHGAGSLIGWFSMAPAFADRFYELTGLGTIWIPNLSKGGCGTLREVSPTFNLDFRGTPSIANGNYYLSTDGSVQMPTIIPRSLQFIGNAMPRFRVAHKILMNFDGGTEFATGFQESTITQQQVIDYHQAMFAYFNSTLGFEKMVIFPNGFIGNTPVEKAADLRDFDSSRTAVLASVNGATILNGCDWLHEFSPLVVDGNGDHVSGCHKHDGGHNSGETNDAIGRTTAQVLATALGY